MHLTPPSRWFSKEIDMLQIATNDEIIINGERTGFSMRQESGHTNIFRQENIFKGVKYEVVKMPSIRYTCAVLRSLPTASYDQLESDLRAMGFVK
jgi:hypothetical protein